MRRLVFFLHLRSQLLQSTQNKHLSLLSLYLYEQLDALSKSVGHLEEAMKAHTTSMRDALMDQRLFMCRMMAGGASAAQEYLQLAEVEGKANAQATLSRNEEELVMNVLFAT
jgi:hypothetical protein